MLGWVFFVLCALAMLVTQLKGNATLFHLATIIALANIVSFIFSRFLHKAKGRSSGVRDTFIFVHFSSSMLAVGLITYVLVYLK